MPRIARRLFTLCAAVLLLACGVVCVLWIVSFFRSDTVGRVGWQDRAAQTWQGWGVVSSRGRVIGYHFTSGVARFDDSPQDFNGVNVPGMQPHAFHHRDSMRVRWTVPMFFFKEVPEGPAASAMRIRFVGVPHWFVAIVFALPAVLAGFRWQVRALKRPRLGRCTTCGYDLRATPERCPECGATRSCAV